MARTRTSSHVRNRGGARFLSDEIAYEKAMAAIHKANQSLRAMAKLRRAGAGKENFLRRKTARKAALKHYDVAGEWGRKIASTRMRRKITSAQQRILTSIESDTFGPAVARVSRSKKRASQRNGLRSIGRSIAKGAKGLAARAKKAIAGKTPAEHRDDDRLDRVLGHARGAALFLDMRRAEHDDRYLDDARREIAQGRRELPKIDDRNKRDRAELQLRKVEARLGLRNGARRRVSASVHSKRLWGD